MVTEVCDDSLSGAAIDAGRLPNQEGWPCVTNPQASVPLLTALAAPRACLPRQRGPRARRTSAPVPHRRLMTCLARASHVAAMTSSGSASQ